MFAMCTRCDFSQNDSTAAPYRLAAKAPDDDASGLHPTIFVSHARGALKSRRCSWSNPPPTAVVWNSCGSRWHPRLKIQGMETAISWPSGSLARPLPRRVTSHAHSTRTRAYAGFITFYLVPVYVLLRSKHVCVLPSLRYIQVITKWHSYLPPLRTGVDGWDFFIALTGRVGCGEVLIERARGL